MKFLNLNSREVSIEIKPDNYKLRTKEECKSQSQYNLRLAIQKIYGKRSLILEEFTIPDSRLKLDYFLPHNSIAFEFQGEQHDKFVKYFHIDKSGLKKQKYRDSLKAKWCEINIIRLIEVRDKDINVDSLRELIYGESSS